MCHVLTQAYIKVLEKLMLAFCEMQGSSCLAGRLLVLALGQSTLLTFILEVSGRNPDATILKALP